MIRQDNATKWVVFGVLLLVLLSAIALLVGLKGKTVVHLGTHTVRVQVAKNPDELTKGLSGAARLDDDQGMLFVFDHADQWPVWMKDMQFSIDIVWLDDQRLVVAIKRNVSPDTYPELFRPGKPARYVLELPAGYVDKYGVGVGTLASFQTW